VVVVVGVVVVAVVGIVVDVVYVVVGVVNVVVMEVVVVIVVGPDFVGSTANQTPLIPCPSVDPDTWSFM
jgi:hypothetical protein